MLRRDMQCVFCLHCGPTIIDLTKQPLSGLILALFQKPHGREPLEQIPKRYVFLEEGNSNLIKAFLINRYF